MNDHDTPDAAYRRLLEVARARLKNHPDLLRSFEHEHTMRRVCGFLAAWAATDSPSMLAPDARLCRIVDEWVQAWKQPLAAGRPIRVQPLDAHPEQTASPAPSASAPPTADTPAPAPSASAPAVALPEPVAAPAEAVPVLEAGASETPAQKRERLQQRVNYWKAQDVRDWTARVAREERVTVARIRQILGKAEAKAPTGRKKAKPRQPATFCSGLMAPASRTR